MDRNLKLLVAVLGLSVLTAALMAQVEPPVQKDEQHVDGPPPPPPGSLAEVLPPDAEPVEPPVVYSDQALPAFGQPMMNGEPMGQAGPQGSAQPSAGQDTASGARPPQDVIVNGGEAPPIPGFDGDASQGPAPLPANIGT